MKIETKFNIGDIVWVYFYDNISECKIEEITIGSNNITYSVSTMKQIMLYNIGEYRIFKTQEEAMQHSIKIAKDNFNLLVQETINECKEKYETKFNVRISNIKFENDEITFDEVKES